jgi:hypothetical protein
VIRLAAELLEKPNPFARPPECAPNGVRLDERGEPFEA